MLLFFAFYFLYSTLFSTSKLWGFVLLKRFSWLRASYESMVEIHPFCLFSILIIWLAACRLHRKSNRFDLISKIWDLSISYHATWFTSEFVKAQTLMSILHHLTLDVYWCSALTVILPCSTPIVCSTHTLSWHYLFARHLNDSTLTDFLTRYLLQFNTFVYIILDIYC